MVLTVSVIVIVIMYVNVLAAVVDGSVVFADLVVR